MTKVIQSSLAGGEVSEAIGARVDIGKYKSSLSKCENFFVQVHGGVAQGIGVALFEEVNYDQEGQLTTANLVDYKIPTASEIPKIDVFHLENFLPKNIGKFKGMGEGGTIGAPAAIANAVADALSKFNVEINELPITHDKIYNLLKKKL